MVEPERPLTDVDVWPLSGLRVTCGDLEMRVPDDPTLMDLARLAARGVHAPDRMPFTSPWTRGTPLQVARNVATYHWGLRARLSPGEWSIDLAVLRDGEALGMQGASASGFGVTRTAETGSWLGLAHQGRGVGTRMRLMMLHLLFEGLGARHATSGAFEDNGPSWRVSERLGYRRNGVQHVAREGRPAVVRLLVLDREDWDARPDDLRLDVRIEGLDPVLEQLGLRDDDAATTGT